jgi:hypothetical protein
MQIIPPTITTLTNKITDNIQSTLTNSATNKTRTPRTITLSSPMSQSQTTFLMHTISRIIKETLTIEQLTAYNHTNTIRPSQYTTQLTYDYIYQTTGKKAFDTQINSKATETALTHYINEAITTANTERAKMNTMLKHIDQTTPETQAQIQSALKQAQDYNTSSTNKTYERIYHHTTKALIQSIQAKINANHIPSDVAIINKYIEANKQVVTTKHMIINFTKLQTTKTYPPHIARNPLEWTGPIYTESMKTKWEKLQLQIKNAYLKATLDLLDDQLDAQIDLVNNQYTEHKILLKAAKPLTHSSIEMHQHRQYWTHECERNKRFTLPLSFIDLIHTNNIPAQPYNHPDTIKNLYSCKEEFQGNTNLFTGFKFNTQCTYTPTSTESQLLSSTSFTSEHNDQEELIDMDPPIPQAPTLTIPPQTQQTHTPLQPPNAQAPTLTIPLQTQQTHTPLQPPNAEHQLPQRPSNQDKDKNKHLRTLSNVDFPLLGNNQSSQTKHKRNK